MTRGGTSLGSGWKFPGPKFGLALKKAKALAGPGLIVKSLTEFFNQALSRLDCVKHVTCYITTCSMVTPLCIKWKRLKIS